MTRIKKIFARTFAAVLLPLAGTVHAATAPQCPFTPDELQSQLGKTFSAGVAESGIIGKACAYKASDIKLWIDAGPLPVASADQWRKMASAPGTKWQTVAGDADKAVHEIAAPGISPFPALGYERGGWLVNITVTGVEGKSAVDAWNAKLVKLRRIP